MISRRALEHSIFASLKRIRCSSVGVQSHPLASFTWDPSKTLVAIGASYIGLVAELSIFDRALSPDEIIALNQLPAGVPGLLR